MRKGPGRSVIGIVALATACGGNALIPNRVPSETTVTFSDAVGDTAIATLGDSVVARATLPYACIGTVSSLARWQQDAVAVTITDSVEFPVPCAYRAGYSTYRAAAGPLPTGRYMVELRFRNVVGSSVTSSTLLRATAEVP